MSQKLHLQPDSRYLTAVTPFRRGVSSCPRWVCRLVIGCRGLSSPEPHFLLRTGSQAHERPFLRPNTCRPAPHEPSSWVQEAFSCRFASWKQTKQLKTPSTNMLVVTGGSISFWLSPHSELDFYWILNWHKIRRMKKKEPVSCLIRSWLLLTRCRHTMRIFLTLTAPRCPPSFSLFI